MIDLSTPHGFQGVADDQPRTVELREVPHWRVSGASYLVTWRLADALSPEQLAELQAHRTAWEQRHPPPHEPAAMEQLDRLITERVQRWLDRGQGSCLVQQPAIAAAVIHALHERDQVDYELAAYLLMPNHVHAIVRPLLTALDDIVAHWQATSIQQISAQQTAANSPNHELHWHPQFFSRLVRDPDHLYRCVQYLARNPLWSGLTADKCPHWIRPDWSALGWNLEVPRSKKQ